MKLLICIILSLFTLSFSGIYKVIGVKDGDTIEILDTASKRTYIVRLAEVDCPEKKQPFGTKAKQFTSDLVYNKYVRVNLGKKDIYNRYIGEVYYNDSIYLSETLIKSGMAWHYKKYSKNIYLSNIETNARKNRIGLWSDSLVVEPRLYRSSKNK